MIELIKNMLVKENFQYIKEEKLENHDSFLGGVKNKTSKVLYFENNEKNFYYILRFYDDHQEFAAKFDGEQDFCFDFLCDKENANEIKKNTSMIVFIRLNSEKEKEYIQGKILELEEDLYYFKKYVVTYTDEEVKDLLEKVHDYDLRKYMIDTVNNVELFQEYKTLGKLSAYSLILKLFIKLPSMSYNDTFKSEDLKDLESKIANDIEKDELADIHKEMLKIDLENIDQWINNKITIDLEKNYE